MIKEIKIELKFQNGISLTTKKILNEEIFVLHANKENINGVIVVTEINDGRVLQETIDKKNAIYKNKQPKKLIYKITLNKGGVNLLSKIKTQALKINIINYFKNEFLGVKRFSVNEEMVSSQQKIAISNSIIKFMSNIKTTDVKSFLGEVSTEIKKQILLLAKTPIEVKSFTGYVNNLLGKMFEIVIYDYLKNRLNNSNIKNIADKLLYVGNKNAGQGDFIFLSGEEEDLENVTGVEKEVAELNVVLEKDKVNKNLASVYVKQIFNHLLPLLKTTEKVESITRFIKYVVFLEDQQKAKAMLIDISKKIGDEKTKSLITSVRLLKNEIDQNKIGFDVIKNSFIEQNRISRSFLYENVNFLSSIKKN